MIYFHSFRNPGLIVDIVRDIRALNEFSRQSRKAGMIILGGGVCKHQIANAMLIVSSLTFTSFVKAAQEAIFAAKRCRFLSVHRKSSHHHQSPFILTSSVV